MSSYMKPNMKAYKAGADLSANQYHFVKWGTADDEVILCGANEAHCGVLMNAPTSGQPAEVALPGGGALLKLDEAISAAGSRLTCTAAGQGEAVDADGEIVSAIAYEAGADGDVIEVYVTPAIKNGAAS